MKRLLSKKLFVLVFGFAVGLFGGAVFAIFVSSDATVSESALDTDVPVNSPEATANQALSCERNATESTCSDATNRKDTDDAESNSTVLPATKAVIPTVIYDTDMGTDIDDAVALAILHGYANEGKIKVGAVVASRTNDTTIRYSDVLNTYYGQPDIPLGLPPDADSNQANNNQYAGDQDFLNNYPYDIANQEVLDSVEVYRKVLAESPDNSVIVVHVGFIESLDLLLNSEPDEFSELNGVDLVSKKVQRLAIMGGNITAIDETGFNFKFASRSSALKTTLDKWPVEILQVQEPFGRELSFPDSAMDNDNTNPLKVSYNKWKPQQNWHTLPNAMRAPDPATSLAGVEPELFDLGNPGELFAQGPTGQHTGFRETSEGKHYVLSFKGSVEEQAASDRMADLASFTP